MKLNKSDLILAFVILAVHIFTISVLWVFYKVSSEPTTLIVSYFGFMTVEVWTLGTIKKHNITSEKRMKKERDKENDAV